MLPTRGTCHAVLIMIRAVQLRRPQSRDEWINASRKQRTFLAAAVDLNKIADVMISFGFVTTHKGIQLSQLTDSVGYQADDATLKRVAKLLLEASPPAWLESASSQGVLAIEYIPQEDLAALQWLGNELERILAEIGNNVSRQKDSELAERLGNAGEQVVMISKAFCGERPSRVSLISAAYGYDVESQGTAGLERIEVKAAVTRSKAGFYISRNEYEKSLHYGAQWYVLQVVFSPAVLFKKCLNRWDILETRVLLASSLHQAIPPDTPEFRWLEAAHLTPPEDSWEACTLPLPTDFEIRLS